MTARDLKEKLRRTKKDIFKLPNEDDIYNGKSDSDVRSQTITNFENNLPFFSEYHPSEYPGELEPYRELKKWYEALGGRHTGRLIVKELIRSYLKEYVSSTDISSIDINTEQMLEPKYSSRMLDGRYPYYSPYEEDKSCKIIISFAQNIDEETWNDLRDIETVNEISEKICDDFLIKENQLDLKFVKRNKAERFNSLFDKRKDNVINALISFSKLSNKNNYKIEEDGLEKVRKAKKELEIMVHQLFKNFEKMIDADQLEKEKENQSNDISSSQELKELQMDLKDLIKIVKEKKSNEPF